MNEHIDLLSSSHDIIDSTVVRQYRIRTGVLRLDHITILGNVQNWPTTLDVQTVVTYYVKYICH